MKRILLACWVGFFCVSPLFSQEKNLRVGFGECDITPRVDGKRSVYIAGFGKNRKATGVHDPLFARCFILQSGDQKVGLVSVDLVGLFNESVERVRKKMTGFSYILVSSTHNHEGPDTMGLWGPNFFQTGVDPEYLKKVEMGIETALQQADKVLQEAQPKIGTLLAPELLHDNRLPKVLHDEMAALEFENNQGKVIGVVVQWNCHPETLDDKNTEISADYVASTVAYLQEKKKCPVVYLTGTVGGLMTSLKVPIRDEKGNLLKDGTFEKTQRYGRLVGEKAEKALLAGKKLSLTPIKVNRQELFLPIENNVYLLGWSLGILDRQAYLWKENPYQAEPAPANAKGKKCLRTEIALLRLGDLELAAIPGEIYPELVLGKIQDPVDPGADFPNAAMEPSIYGQMSAKYKMLVGLANDEIGYIIPKRQWDEKAPFCYGRKQGQYGEINSLGSETAPLLCEAFRKLVEKK